MKECGKYDYVTHSKEFRVFARDKGDIEKMLQALSRLTPLQILEKYRLNFNIDEDQDANPLAHYKENIIDFQQFLRRAIPLLENQKKQLKKMLKTREEQDASYYTILNALTRYEDNNIEYYSDGNPSRRVLTHPDANGETKEKVMHTFKQTLRNPYAEAYLVIKGELLDLRGISDALMGREQVVKQLSATESKKRSDQQEMEKLSQGKTTLKSIFKSAKSKDNEILALQAGIEVANKDIQDYKKLIHYLTIYHGQFAIQKFKREKAAQYKKLMHNFAVKEISNAHELVKFWHACIELCQKQ